jgi:hypothetical protein
MQIREFVLRKLNPGGQTSNIDRFTYRKQSFQKRWPERLYSTQDFRMLLISVVDPDPVGPGTFCLSGYVIHSGSGF